MKWKETFTTASEFQRISILMPALYLEEAPQRCKFQLVLMRKPTNIKESNNSLLELVILKIFLVGYALEVIPKTLATNCGMDVVRIITELRAKHAEPGH